MTYNLILKTPIGTVKTSYTEKGISTISLDASFNNKINVNELLFSDLKVTLLDHITEKNEMQQLIEAWFTNYFCGDSSNKDILPVDNELISSKKFTSKVLNNLIEVPFGSTITYKELAKLSGNSNSSRAVGQAMGKNPLPLLFPCHRVVNSNGEIGNYMHGQGNNIKCWLISFEKMKLKNEMPNK